MLKRRVGEIADLKQQLDSHEYLLAQKQSAITTLRSKKTSMERWLVVSIIIGALLLIVIIGVAFFIAAYVLYRRRRKVEMLVQESTAEIAKMHTEIAVLNSSLYAKLSALSPDIFNELSAVHQVRVAATSSGSTVQLVKETIREVVMIPCAYCHSLIPQASLRCPQCGATRKQ